MVQLNSLPRPNKKSADKTSSKTAETSAADTSLPTETSSPPAKSRPAEAAPDTSNLHKPVRGEPVFKQFRLDPDIVREFTIAAREHGYRRDNQFFVAVWEFWKKHNA